MASSNDDTYFKFRPTGNYIIPEYYEGFAHPRIGRTPFKIIDNPAIIAKKNQMREALREEYTRRIYNPYRWASGVGGHVFDPAAQRYYSTTRVGWEYMRPGFKMNLMGLTIFLIFPYALIYTVETSLRKRELEKRMGLIAYKDRNNKFMT